MSDVIQIVLLVIKIVLFIVFYLAFSKLFIRIFIKRKPEIRFFDPEIIFSSVLCAVAITKVVMIVVKKIIL